MTLNILTAAFSTVRPSVERSRDSRGISNPVMDLNAKTHDYTMFKSLLDSITDLAQSRLLGIIRNRKRLVDSLPRGDSRQAHPAPPPAHHQAAHQKGAASHTHRARTTRAPESTSITKRWRYMEVTKALPGYSPFVPLPPIGLYTLCVPDVLHMPPCKGFLSFFLSFYKNRLPRLPKRTTYI